MRRKTNPGSGPTPPPAPSWLVGAAIGLTIMSMAGSAMAFGAGLAWTQATGTGK